MLAQTGLGEESFGGAVGGGGVGIFDLLVEGAEGIGEGLNEVIHGGVVEVLSALCQLGEEVGVIGFPAEVGGGGRLYLIFALGRGGGLGGGGFEVFFFHQLADFFEVLGGFVFEVLAEVRGNLGLGDQDLHAVVEG